MNDFKKTTVIVISNITIVISNIVLATIIFYWGVFSTQEGHRSTLETAIAVLRHNYILVCIFKCLFMNLAIFIDIVNFI